MPDNKLPDFPKSTLVPKQKLYEAKRKQVRAQLPDTIKSLVGLINALLEDLDADEEQELEQIGDTIVVNDEGESIKASFSGGKLVITCKDKRYVLRKE
jgi:hypothetical protein